MTDLVTKAEQFARRAHAGQTRKGKTAPFVTHLETAYGIAKDLTDDENILASVWLHDTVEDTDVTLEDIAENFNPIILEHVDIESEIKEEDEQGSWKRRKENQLKVFKSLKNKDTLYITFADKLANLTEMADDYAVAGDDLFKIFNNKDKSAHKWYYSEFYKLFKNSGLFNDTHLQRYKNTMNKMF